METVLIVIGVIFCPAGLIMFPTLCYYSRFWITGALICLFPILLLIWGQLDVLTKTIESKGGDLWLMIPIYILYLLFPVLLITAQFLQMITMHKRKEAGLNIWGEVKQ